MMITAGKYALSVAIGGITLGALLGGFADPTMKQAPEQWWQFSGRAEAAATTTDQVWPQVSSVYPDYADSYRPNLDYDAAITSYWEPPADLHWYSEEETSFQPLANDPVLESGPAGDVEKAGDEAQQAAQAADDAQHDAQEAALAQAAPVVSTRISPLVSEGIY